MQLTMFLQSLIPVSRMNWMKKDLCQDLPQDADSYQLTNRLTNQLTSLYDVIKWSASRQRV